MVKVVVIGGSGAVGRLVVPLLAAGHDVTIADVRPPAWWQDAFVEIDVTDPSTMEGLFSGQDALVYMAMGPMEDWDTPQWAQAHFAVNVAGLYAALQAAGEQGIRRVVLASSASIFEDFEERPDADVPDATDGYGVSKGAGEFVARAASRQFDLPVVALRMVLPREDEEYLAAEDDQAELATSATDTAAAYLAALERDIPPGFHAVTISGNPRWGRKRQERASQLLDWLPTITRRRAPGPPGGESPTPLC